MIAKFIDIREHNSATLKLKLIDTAVGSCWIAVTATQRFAAASTADKNDQIISFLHQLGPAATVNSSITVAYMSHLVKSLCAG